MSFYWIDDIVMNLGASYASASMPRKPQDTDFQELEKALGGKLPSEYCYFIERYGGSILGGEGHEALSPILEPCSWGDATRPEFFHSLSAVEDDNALRVWHIYRGRLPVGVMSVSYDGADNQICLDVAGAFPGSVWFWDHEQRWFADSFPGSLEEAARELDREGIDARRLSVHDIIRGWARLHASRWDRPPDYMGMYRMADSFADFLRSLRRVRYDVD
jgi:SMI1 / KNR4 family (SUKH-1)